MICRKPLMRLATEFRRSTRRHLGYQELHCSSDFLQSSKRLRQGRFPFMDKKKKTIGLLDSINIDFTKCLGTSNASSTSGQPTNLKCLNKDVRSNFRRSCRYTAQRSQKYCKNYFEKDPLGVHATENFEPDVSISPPYDQSDFQRP